MFSDKTEQPSTGMQEHLLAETIESEPAAQATQTVAVAAPADLQAGYTFDAAYNGSLFRVTVPEGGVIRGQQILVNVPVIAVAEVVTVSSPVLSGSTIENPRSVSIVPTGRWREGFCDCCEHGCCEPTCCLACWCPGVVLGQVMTRLKLTALAEPASRASTAAKTFALVSALWIIFIVLDFVKTSFVQVCDETGCYTDLSQNINGLTATLSVITSLLALYFVYIGTMTRIRMRRAFQIRGNCLGDCCAYYWCPCCTITQMARHTHDYEVHEGSCFSKTGLWEGAPEVV